MQTNEQTGKQIDYYINHSLVMLIDGFNVKNSYSFHRYIYSLLLLHFFIFWLVDLILRKVLAVRLLFLYVLCKLYRQG